jgi:tRNA threonylcarbamoyladenosine biosynthesis protein TsaE
MLLRSPKETHRLGQRLGTLLQGGEVLALRGDLGTGKTAFVRGIAEGLLAEPTEVSSPTFTLIHEYQGRLPFIHTDLYRLTAEELENTGLNDYLDGHTVTAIEWADRWTLGLPPDRLDICLAHCSSGGRRVSLAAQGPSAQRLLDELCGQLAKRRPPGAPRQSRVQLPRSRRTSL